MHCVTSVERPFARSSPIDMSIYMRDLRRPMTPPLRYDGPVGAMGPLTRLVRSKSLTSRHPVD